MAIKSKTTVKKKPVSRPSQITKKAPTKRLVARRKKNTEKGYFPNPAKKSSVEYRKELSMAFYRLSEYSGEKNLASKQALISYCQGLIAAGHLLRVLSAAEAKSDLETLKGYL